MLAMGMRVRDAKDFLVGRIAEEASREGAPLSEAERKTLHFSLDDPEAADPGDLDEERVAGLIRSARKRAKREDPREFETWSEAIHALGEGDHYLMVMIRQAGAERRPRADLLRLWATGLAIAAGLLGLIALALYKS